MSEPRAPLPAPEHSHVPFLAREKIDYVKPVPRGRLRGLAPARRARAATLVGCLAASLILAGPGEARAQSSIGIGFYTPGGAFRPEVSARDLRVFVRVFGLSDEERAALESLHAAYVEALEVRSREIKRIVNDMLEEAEVVEDRRLIESSTVQGKIAEWDREAEKMKSQFLEDLRSVLTREQESQWPILERELRRLREIGNGRMSGESVDLSRLVDTVVPGAWEHPDVADLMEQYAVGIDRLLLARDAATTKRKDDFEEAIKGSDASRAERIWNDAQASRIAIRDWNARFVREIGARIDPDDAAKLDRAYFEAAYSRLCQPTRGETYIRAAANLDSLSDSQRAEVAGIMEPYERARLAILRRIAAAEQELQERHIPSRLAKVLGQDPEGKLSSFDGASRLPADHPLLALRRERLELDRQYRRRIDAVLQEWQREQVPVPSEGWVSFTDWTPWSL